MPGLPDAHSRPHLRYFPILISRPLCSAPVSHGCLVCALHRGVFGRYGLPLGPDRIVSIRSNILKEELRVWWSVRGYLCRMRACIPNRSGTSRGRHGLIVGIGWKERQWEERNSSRHVVGQRVGMRLLDAVVVKSSVEASFPLSTLGWQSCSAAVSGQ